MGEIAPQLIALVLLVIASAFFSGTEVALFSLRRIDREEFSKSKKKSHNRIYGLLQTPRRLITAILLGNEVVNVSISVTVASMAPILYKTTDDVTLTLLSTFTVLPILLCFGEILPKTLAFKRPRRWSAFASGPLALWSIITWPIRRVIRAVVNVLLWFFGLASQRPVKPLSEQEFVAMVDAGSAEGQVNAREKRLIHKVFEFDDKTVGQIMIPRSKVFALSYDLSRIQLIETIASRGYSRVPIFQRSLDNIQGVLFAKDLVAQAMEIRDPLPLAEMLQRPLYVPKSLKCEMLFQIFKNRRTHMALVVDEYGKMLGIVTMEDLLEELFGEIRDEREQQKSKSGATL